MPRITLSGRGVPIPQLALPPFGSETNLPPMVLTFTADENFAAGEYRALGFTHFEVWCVGGAGGRGGAGSTDLAWPSYLSGGKTHWHDPAPINPFGYGGAGGGGGLHKTQGLLSALPDICPVVVGHAGADAPIGLFTVYTVALYDSQWHMTPVTAPFTPTPQDNVLSAQASDIYDQPHPVFGPPVSGGDGQASSFNGVTCRASGGKGGSPAGHPDSGMVGLTNGPDWGIVFDGDGGSGGAGGRTLAGGGAAGGSIDAVMDRTTNPDIVSRYDVIAPVDGAWDGTIGQGGGGGYGGAFRSVPSGDARPPREFLLLAASGSQGSYSFGDTTYFGTRELRTADPSNGRLVVPGNGGGARPTSGLKVGSRAPGYSPDGVVVVRLTQIV